MIDALLPPVHLGYIAIIAGNIKVARPDITDFIYRS